MSDQEILKYLNNELAEKELVRFKQRLAEDPALRHEVEAVRVLQGGADYLKNLDDKPSPTLRVRVMQEVDAAAEASFWSRVVEPIFPSNRLVRPLAALAVLVIVVSLVYQVPERDLAPRRVLTRSAPAKSKATQPAIKVDEVAEEALDEAVKARPESVPPQVERALTVEPVLDSFEFDQDEAPEGELEGAPAADRLPVERVQEAFSKERVVLGETSPKLEALTRGRLMRDQLRASAPSKVSRTSKSPVGLSSEFAAGAAVISPRALNQTKQDLRHEKQLQSSDREADAEESLLDVLATEHLVLKLDANRSVVPIRVELRRSQFSEGSELILIVGLDDGRKRLQVEFFANPQKVDWISNGKDWAKGHQEGRRFAREGVEFGLSKPSNMNTLVVISPKADLKSSDQIGFLRVLEIGLETEGRRTRVPVYALGLDRPGGTNDYRFAAGLLEFERARFIGSKRKQRVILEAMRDLKPLHYPIGTTIMKTMEKLAAD